MKEKRITLRVTEDTYRRWKDAAKADDRTLVAWICRRADGKEAVAPSEVAPLPSKEAPTTELPPEEVPLTIPTPVAFPQRGIRTGLLAHVQGLPKS